MKRSQRFKKSSLKIKIFAGLFFCLLAGLAYLFIWSPVFEIKQIDVKHSIFNKEIREIVQSNLKQKSIFLAPIEKIKKEILERFPEIKEVVIKKQIPDYLGIEIIERSKIGIWCQKETNNCFYIDQEGIIYKESPLISGSLILNIYSRKDQLAQIRDKVVAPEIIDFILTISPALELMDFEVVAPEDLRVTTAAGWQIYFNPGYSAEAQLKALEMLLDEEIKENRDSLEYIDLRIEGRAYYR